MLSPKKEKIFKRNFVWTGLNIEVASLGSVAGVVLVMGRGRLIK
jgi:hypothetical protein